tara:strand:+ start:4052 stop:4549 length:498 start_codon:yes stop_codon:yes gene_type:complete
MPPKPTIRRVSLRKARKSRSNKKILEVKRRRKTRSVSRRGRRGRRESRLAWLWGGDKEQWENFNVQTLANALAIKFKHHFPDSNDLTVQIVAREAKVPLKYCILFLLPGSEKMILFMFKDVESREDLFRDISEKHPGMKEFVDFYYIQLQVEHLWDGKEWKKKKV